MLAVAAHKRLRGQFLSHLYPRHQCRWTLGVGRIGAIVGPTVGGAHAGAALEPCGDFWRKSNPGLDRRACNSRPYAIGARERDCATCFALWDLPMEHTWRWLIPLYFTTSYRHRRQL